MTERAPLYLGEPDFDDVESAAILWNQYRADGEVSRETFQMFSMMCSSFRAVSDRADELLKQSGAA